MELDGVPTIYSGEVTYFVSADPNQPNAPQAPLRANQMLLFATKHDAEQLLPLANQACGGVCELAGATAPLTLVVTGVGTVVAVNDPCYGAIPGATVCYHTATGPRPYKLLNQAHRVDQYVADLVAKHTPDKSALKLSQVAAGATLLVWA